MVEKVKDDIDLVEVLIKVKNVLFQNKIIIISLTVIGMLLGFVYYKLKPAIFESEIVVRTTILNEPLLNIINENLSHLIQENNRQAIATKLNLTPDVAKLVASISIEPTDENASKQLDYAFYIIKVKSSSSEYWPEIEQGMIYYLSNNVFVKKRIDLKTSQYESFITKLDAEINEIDSLKRGLYKSENLSRDNVVLMNPGEVYTALLQLFERRQKLEEELAFNQAVEIVEDFDAYKRPVSPRPVFLVIVGAVIGFLIGLFIAFGRELNSYLKQYERTHS